MHSAVLASLGLATLVACRFDGSTPGVLDGAVIDADPIRPDARSFPDAMPRADAIAICTPQETVCVDGVLETCHDNGQGLDPLQAEPCSFACVDDDHCVSASNLSAAQVSQCDGGFAPLAPGADATVKIVDNAGTPEIQCAPDCGDGSTTVIAAQPLITGSPDLATFCLSILDLPLGSTIGADANLPWAVVLLVDGTATLAGSVDLSGGDGSSTGAGTSGPGGGVGGPLHNLASAPGLGSCPGLGGVRGGSSGDRIGGGGGGGGLGGIGGSGGRGKSLGNDTAAGGLGASACGNDPLIPLVAGSGGGSGGDGTGGTIGWPGGGGGGALQVSAKVSLSFAGSIVASGGNGFGDPDTFNDGGGGGGGSGGALLLEAPILSFEGSILVDGGDGAGSTAGDGGAGGSSVEIEGQGGADEGGSNEAGAGGGGGGGRVRLNATLVPICQNVSPAEACTPGTMATP